MIEKINSNNKFMFVINNTIQREHFDEYFPKFPTKNILYLYDISSLRKGNLKNKNSASECIFFLVTKM
jgi:hypothetical protein